MEFNVKSFVSKKTQKVLDQGEARHGLYYLTSANQVGCNFFSMPFIFFSNHTIGVSDRHGRLTYPSDLIMRKFVQHALLPSYTNFNNNKTFSLVFPMTKSHNLPFVSHHVKFYRSFDLIYIDLWTSPVLANIRTKYLLLIVDDFNK